jgi:hypothetical protein
MTLDVVVVVLVETAGVEGATVMMLTQAPLTILYPCWQTHDLPFQT